MNGAREYAKLFKTGQYGKLYITSGSHARVLTFRIQVLPEGEKAIPNGDGNQCLNKDAVSVYDVVSGNRGWTESYGWIHDGKWKDDFEAMVVERKAQIEKENELHSKRAENAAKENSILTESLLSKY